MCARGPAVPIDKRSWFRVSQLSQDFAPRNVNLVAKFLGLLLGDVRLGSGHVTTYSIPGLRPAILLYTRWFSGGLAFSCGGGVDLEKMWRSEGLYDISCFWGGEGMEFAGACSPRHQMHSELVKGEHGSVAVVV